MRVSGNARREVKGTMCEVPGTRESTKGVLAWGGGNTVGAEKKKHIGGRWNATREKSDRAWMATKHAHGGYVRTRLSESLVVRGWPNYEVVAFVR